MTGHTQLAGVDNNDVITGVNVRRVLGLVFAAQTARDLDRNATQYFFVGVYQKPLAPHFVRLG